MDISRALEQLAACDDALSGAIKAVGTPTIRSRDPGYKGLFRIILQQQLSVASARAILARCEEAMDIADPEHVLTIADEVLQTCGVSRPKIRYLKAAAAYARAPGWAAQVARMDDQDALDHLLEIKGVGPWSAAIYLLFCEGRMSIWPPKDVALLAAYTHAAGLAERPSMAEFDALAADRFQPLPGLAAHILWSYYGVIKDRPPV